MTIIIAIYDYYNSHAAWQSVNKTQATPQMTGQAVNFLFTKKWSVKTNLTW